MNNIDEPEQPMGGDYVPKKKDIHDCHNQILPYTTMKFRVSRYHQDFLLGVLVLSGILFLPIHHNKHRT